MSLAGWLHQWVVWGFAATVVLTAALAGGQGLGLTRMSIPYLLGTMLTPDRDRAKMWGIVVHVANGWVFALFYLAAFAALGASSWWRGALIGFVHGLFVVAVTLPAMPAVHPRMASEQQGPTALRPLEPPGFLGLHYGSRTPISIVAAHVLYGIVLGACCHS
jgi:hypothetical protein